MESEVARILADIELNFRAAQSALRDPSLGASTHMFITKKMERIEQGRVTLIDIIGSEKASTLLNSTLDNIEAV